MSERTPRFLDEPDGGGTSVAAARVAASDAAPVRRPVLLEPTADAPSVIDQGWRPAAVAAVAPGTGALGWLMGGVALLVLVWLALSGVELAWAAFDRAPAYGWVATAGLLAAGAMIAWAGWAEWRAFRALARVDRLRRLLADDRAALAGVQAAAGAWVARISRRLAEPDAVQQAVAGAQSVAELRAVLQHRVGAPLGEAAGQLGTRAAMQAGALVALCPHPALDALLAGWRGLRLIREVAALYGLRPGTLATLALARRVAVTAAGTAGVELLSQTLSDQLLQRMPVLSHLVAAVPGATLAAVRLYRLARISALACSPLARAE